MLAVRTVPDLTVHDHLCFVHDGDAEARRNLVEYAVAGLARRERVCVCAAASIDGDLRAYGLPVSDLVDSGKLVIDSAERAPLAGGIADPGRRLAAYADAAGSALAEGFTGLRVYVETHFLRESPAAWPGYELRVDLLAKQLPVTAVCAYDARVWNRRDLLLAETIHTRRSRGHSTYRLCAGRDGTLWLSGEVDFLAADQLYRLLVGVVPDWPTAVLDVSGLGFVDVQGARSLGTACEEIAGRRGPTTLRGGTPLLRGMWEPADWSELFPNVLLEDRR